MKKHPDILVVPLGPGSPRLLTLEAADALRDSARKLILRTARHPVAAWLEEQQVPFSSLDAMYDAYEDFDALHRAMAGRLWEAASGEAVCFAVPDPAADAAVAALKTALPAGGSLRILPGVSAAQACLSALPAEQSTENGLQLFSANRFLSAAFDPSLPLLLTELDSSLLAGDIKLKLADLFSDEQPVLFFPPREDSPSETSPVFRRIPLYALDAQKKYDHTAAVFLPGVPCSGRERHTFRDLTEIVFRLRAPDGCPWDRAQTHQSLRPYLVEEAWEAVNAIDEGDTDHLADELGDVLFQVMIHSAIGTAFDEFTLTDVLSGICRKMIQRHPHVFIASHGESAEDVSQGWEARKRKETGSRTVGETLDDVSSFLPALKYSIKMYKKLAQVPALRRDPRVIAEEIRELSGKVLENGRLSEAAMSALLRKCTELCYRTDQDAEILLHQGVEQMKNIYQKAEKTIFEDKKSPESLTLQELCVYLNSAEKENRKFLFSRA